MSDNQSVKNQHSEISVQKAPVLISALWMLIFEHLKVMMINYLRCAPHVKIVVMVC